MRPRKVGYKNYQHNSSFVASCCVWDFFLGAAASSQHKNRKSFVVLFGCVFLSFFFHPSLLLPLDHIILSLNKQTFWQQPKRNETKREEKTLANSFA